MYSGRITPPNLPQKPTQSPRPSILRKRNKDGLSPAKKVPPYNQSGGGTPAALQDDSNDHNSDSTMSANSSPGKTATAVLMHIKFFLVNTH